MNRETAYLVEQIIRDAGGKIVGCTRLQKTAYFLAVTGCGEDFDFRYKRLGPYSEEVAQAVDIGVLFGAIREKEKKAIWGGFYSIYKVEGADDLPSQPGDQNVRRTVAHLCANTGAIALELASTAVFLSKNGYENPWYETKRRKLEKAQSHFPAIRSFLAEMDDLPLPKALPQLLPQEVQ